ncbi:MAG: CBS domain-containing protein [Acidobacteria bacterium]|nr:MAG: CBS domain-containing protein [Acidobacteriota bacterium]
MFYLTELINLPLRGGDGHRYGNVRELVVEPEADDNLVRRVIYRHNGNLWEVPLRLLGLDLEGMTVEMRQVSPVPMEINSGHLLLRHDVLDQQIIDVNGRRVVRVNDIGMDLREKDGSYELRAQQVDIGVSGALRRLLQGAVPRAWLKGASEWPNSRPIPWRAFDLVETDPARRIRLQITYRALGRLHPADAADIMEELAPAGRDAVFGSLDHEVAADILGEVTPKLQRSLIEGLESDHAADIIEEMEPDEAADVLADLPAEQSEEILREMEAPEREDVADLLEYPEDTAGGRMTTEFIAVPESATAAAAIAATRAFEGPISGVTTIFLLNDEGQLSGAVPVSRILLAAPSNLLQDMADEAIAVERERAEADVAELFNKYNLLALPVVDDQRRVLGVVTADDVISWLSED